MNRAILLGRLTKDPELRTTSSNVSVCSFTLAIDRRFKNANGERETDFIPCVAWRQQAEFAARYFSKGSMMAVVGSIQPRSWDDPDGKRHYTTEVIVDEIYFAGNKRDEQGQSSNNYRSKESGSTGYGRDNSGYRKQDAIPEGEGFLPVDDESALPFDL